MTNNAILCPANKCANTPSDAEEDAAIAYFQSYWNDAIYQGWIKRGRLDQ